MKELELISGEQLIVKLLPSIKTHFINKSLFKALCARCGGKEECRCYGRTKEGGGWCFITFSLLTCFVVFSKDSENIW